MAVNLVTGSFNLTTGAATTTQDVAHGLGTTPTFLLLWNAGGAFTGTIDSTTGTSLNYQLGLGVDATSRAAMTYRSNDNAATWTGSHGQRADAIVYAHNHGGIVSGQMDLLSLDATNFTLEVDVTSGAIRTHFLALGGDVSAALVQGAEPGATGDVDFTSSGFGTPTGALFFSVSDTSLPLAGSANDGRMMIGAYDGTTNGVVLVAGNSGTDPTETNRYGTSTDCIALPDATGGTLDARASGVSFITDGVRVNFGSRASTRVIWVVLIKGCLFKVFESATRTDGNDIAITGLGGTPKGGLVFSHCAAESAAGTVDAHAGWSLGAWDSATSRRAASYWDEDNVATSEVAAGIEHDEVLLKISAADAVEALMDVKSVDADGVTFVMDTAEPTAASWFGGVIIGESAGGGDPEHIPPAPAQTAFHQTMVAM